MAEPEVARDESADGGVLQRWALLAGQAESHCVPSVLPVARQVQVLFNPELEEAVGVPGRRLVGIEGPAARVVAVAVLHLHGGVGRVVGVGLHACSFGYDPRLLAGGGHKHAGDLVWRAHAQAERVPLAVDALPVLIGGHGYGLGRVLVVGETWREEEEQGGDEEAQSGVWGASVAMLVEGDHIVDSAPRAGDFDIEATQPREQWRASPLRIALRQSFRRWGTGEADGRQRAEDQQRRAAQAAPAGTSGWC